MVVGRACDSDELPEEPSAGQSWRAWTDELAARHCMSWVSDQWGPGEHDYNTARSAFWRVIRLVTLELIDQATEEDWPAHLVWSNLYKVAPVGTRENPGARLRDAQRDGCKGLLDLEIRTFRPKRLLFLTGWDWAEELICAPPEAREPEGYVDKVWSRSLDSESGSAISRFVVARHPQGKKQDQWVHGVLQEFR